MSRKIDCLFGMTVIDGSLMSQSAGWVPAWERLKTLQKKKKQNKTRNQKNKAPFPRVLRYYQYAEPPPPFATRRLRHVESLPSSTCLCSFAWYDARPGSFCFDTDSLTSRIEKECRKKQKLSSTTAGSFRKYLLCHYVGPYIS